MRLPSLARGTSSLVRTLAVCAVLSACANDAVAPVASTGSATPALAPTATAKSLVGVQDGTYNFEVDPQRPQFLLLGLNFLSIPAEAICERSTASYGIGHWSERCKPERKRLTITAVVRNAKSAHPSIDFSPALRFSPDKVVSLFMYVPQADRGLGSKPVLNYCSDAPRVCVDESLTDPSVRTYYDSGRTIAFRRIKHFSGYIVAFATELLSNME